MNIKDFSAGQTVFCYSFGNWYEGTVDRIGRTRLYVTYTTGSGTTRTKAFHLDHISLEKHDGGRQQAAREKRLRNIEYSRAMVGEPVMRMTENGPEPIPHAVYGMSENGSLVVMHQRKLEFGQVESVRLFCAFQALCMPSRFYHGSVTHGKARKIIEEMTGIRLKKTAKPPRPGTVNGLEDYIEWASNPDLQVEREEKFVFLRPDDEKDKDGQWSVGIFSAEDPKKCQERIKAGSQETAFDNARLAAENYGWTIVDGIESDHAHQG